MNRYQRMRISFAGLLAALALLIPLATPANAAGFPLSPSDPRIQAALDFLRHSETTHSALWTNMEKACYAIAAIEACGADAHTFINAEGKSLVDIIRENAPAYLKPQSSASLAHASYLFAIVAAGEDPHNFAGIDVVAQLKSMFDGTQIGMPGIINDDFWAIITLVGAGESPGSPIIQTSKGHILANQSPDGGWGCNTGGTSSDPCDTANAIMALRAAGESPSSPTIQKALTYLRSMQKSDGGFPYYANYPSDSGSDARVIAALRACGIDPTSPEWSINGQNAVTHALSLQQPDGGFAWYSGGSTDAWMTTYIMPALVGKHWPPDLFAGSPPPAATVPPVTPSSTPESTPGVMDTDAPVIGAVMPAHQETVDTGKPTVRATYNDAGSGIALSSITLKIDGADVTGWAAVTLSEIVYTPASILRNGTHTGELIVSDRAGNRTRKTWNFNVLDPSAALLETTEPTATTIAPGKPIIIVLSPAPGERVSTPFPTISAAYSAPGSAIDPEKVTIIIDSVDVTPGANITETHFAYTPRRGLVLGTHTAEVIVQDRAGNRTRKSWNFNVESGPASAADLARKIDAAGNTLEPIELSFCEHMVRIEIARGTRLLDDAGNPLTWIDARRAAAELIPPAELCPIGPVYLLEPAEAAFDPPAEVTLIYLERAAGEGAAWDTDGNGIVDTLDLVRMGTPEWEGIRESDFRIAFYDRERDTWVILDENRAAIAENTITVRMARLGPVVIVGKAAVTPGSAPSPAALAAGTVRSPDGKAELSLEEGTIGPWASMGDAVLTRWGSPAAPPEGLCRIGPAYVLAPQGGRLSPSAFLTLRYDEATLSGGIRWDTSGDGALDLLDDQRASAPEDFRIARFDPASEQWELLPSMVDRQARTVAARIDRCGEYAIMGPAASPLIVHRIETVPPEAKLGEPVALQLFVENPGGGKGTYLLTVIIDGVPEYEREVTLAPGEHEIAFVHREPYAGEHTVAVGGATAVFTVGASADGSSAFPMVIGGVVGGGIIIAGLVLFGWRGRRRMWGGHP